ncbi:DNA repair protein XRCC3 [Poecilia formosa]|uniref:DNA repair protein XRCC3 n=1 Tax=Poecilia formosa TaxID=48698 RepID=UPI0004442D9C|nr:PREDICTED: DNA repair protein XRCC3 [Poecilia formosa]
MNWDQLQLKPRIISAVQRAHLKSFREVLVFSEPDLQKMTGLSRPDVQELLHAAATACRTRQPITALQLQRGECRRLESGLRLGTGCPVLDQLLRGGLPVGGVTELAGESGAGKTQLGLQLCLSVQYPVEHGGLSAGALYICTEDPFPIRRLQQLISEQTSLRSDVPPSLIGRLRFSDNIYLEHAADLDSLQVCLSRRAALLLAQGRVRLVVVDSVAALFRCEFQPGDWLERNKQLLTVSSMVHHLSHEFTTPVVCINQVTDVFHQPESSSSSPSSSVSPALGLAWANQVTVRLMMRRLQVTVSRGDQSSALRRLEVVFAPHLARSSRDVAVWREGLRGVLDPVLAPFGPDVAQQEMVLPLPLCSV